MPTVDIALFSRTIYLTFDKTVYDREAKQKFNELTAIRKMGVSHLTNEILSHRNTFESDFYNEYNFVCEDIAMGIQNNEVEDRIWRDWQCCWPVTVASCSARAWTYNGHTMK